MGFAARVTDMHICGGSHEGVPHVGGPILPPGAPTVLIAGKPAAVVGGAALCVGAPDFIVKGSGTVFIQGQPAVRVGDTTMHGGLVVSGVPNVIIGD